MNQIKVLDCTLRDGGYVNNWHFGEQNINFLIQKLTASEMDIIECGFLSNKITFDKDSTRFPTIDSMKALLPTTKTAMYVCMINFGEYAIADIPSCDGSIEGIRVAFHKKDLHAALELCQGIQQKGYKVFIQPMVSVTYSDIEFVDLIKQANKINPYAFYIVDSFGVMRRNELMRLYHLVDHNLDKDIYVGFHSHNNIQLSYSNAQALVDLKTKRKMIIDASVMGMGRGAGNLNSELFVEYLNDINGTHYKVKPLLQIIDKVLNTIYQSEYWGYSLPHYISAKHNCHPNYATHLSAKDTLTAEDISNILMKMSDDKKINFDVEYIESLYRQYQAHKVDDRETIKQLTAVFQHQQVVVIAPGKSINDHEAKIKEMIALPDTLVVAVNFVPHQFKTDYIFVSNLKRYEQLTITDHHQLIVTSNLTSAKEVEYQVNYIDLLVENPLVSDNAGLMLIKLLTKLQVKSLYLAGFDGYSYNAYENYAEKEMTFVKTKPVVDLLNNGMRYVLSDFKKQIQLSFITASHYEDR
jgi:4-hydroxy 2-oxovalerate aldolase